MSHAEVFAEPVQLPIDALKPHPANARRHSAEQIRAIARAIARWGFTQPIVADADRTVLIGHGRLEAARSLGLDHVPVILRPDLDAAAARALILADNRLHELGRWDRGMLEAETRYLAGAGFDLSLAALDLPEIGMVPEQDLPPVAIPDQVAAPGDIWQLGAHRLAVGAAQDLELLEALCAGARPGLIVTRQDGQSPLELAGAVRASRANAAYIWHDTAGLPMAVGAARAAGLDIRCQIICPQDITPTRKAGYARAHACGIYAGKSGAVKWRGGRAQSTLWEDASDMARYHRPMVNHLAQGGVVLDPFCSEADGVVFRAASQAQRIALGLVEDPAAADIILRRWQMFTGKSAVLAATGKPFGD